jgi:hypothetical protein
LRVVAVLLVLMVVAEVQVVSWPPQDFLLQHQQITQLQSAPADLAHPIQLLQRKAAILFFQALHQPEAATECGRAKQGAMAAPAAAVWMAAPVVQVFSGKATMVVTAQVDH